MPFGNDTITFVRKIPGVGPADELGHIAPTELRVDAPNCRHRTLSLKETAETEFDVATELWKSTIPIGEYPEPLQQSLMATQPIDHIEVNGRSYQIIGGVRWHPDMDSRPFKVTIMSQKQTG